MAGPLARPARSGEELLAALPGVERIASVSVEQLANLPGVELRPALAAEALAAADRALEAGAGGCVLVQGTDTIEETAELADLLWAHEAPLVVTGAMRPASAPGADGPANLLDAIRVAASRDARGAGALVCLDGLVHEGSAAFKSHSWRPAAFESPAPLGTVCEGEVRLRLRVDRRPPVGSPREALAGGLDRHVPIVTAAAGVDSRMLDAALDQGAEAIVLAALGAGHVPAAMLDGVDRALATGVPVIVCARPPRGGTLRRTYGFDGSESDLERRGAILAGEATPWKARIRALVARALELDPRELF